MFWSRKPKTKEVPVAGSAGFSTPFGLAYTRHAQPDPGIAAFSYDAMALPLYTAIGGGVQNARQFKSAPSNTVVYQRQAIALTTVGNPGNLAGTFGSGPLIDTTSQPGDPSPNAIPAPGSFMLPQGV